MQPISLLELNQAIGNALSSNLEPSYWIIAEIADIKVNQKGHCYLELVQKADEKILAKSRATIWAYEFRNISFRFEQITGKGLANGMKILINAVVQYHQVYGLSLNIRDIDPNFTLGEKARRRKEILDRLKSEGLFDRNKRLRLPIVPQRIAVISSPTAAGFGDFVHQLQDNAYGYSFKIKLFKAILQGEEAVFSISQAVERAGSMAEDFDLVVLVRGGGSQIDLDCFDSYEISAAIAQSKLPVITGIGHERDETIVDMVAHTRLKTPSAVGEFLVDGIMNFDAELENLLHQIKFRYTAVIHREEKKLDNRKYQILQSFRELLKAEMYKTESLAHHLKSAADQWTKMQSYSVSLLEEKLLQLDPRNVLKRGYTISTINGTIVKSYPDLQETEKGSVLTTYGSDFTLESELTKIGKRNDEGKRN